MGEAQFRIQKVSLRITCDLLGGEVLNGEIFLDMLSSTGASAHQVLEFFNSPAQFFPLRVQSEAILVAKRALTRIEIHEDFAGRYLEEQSSQISQKRQAIFHIEDGETLEGTVILDLPEEHSRVLDLVNLPGNFFPVVAGE